MLRQRRRHNKSREGCLQCKERHVKCNEAHPRCLNCDRFGVACSFSSPSLSHAAPLDDGSLADLELLDYWHQHPPTHGQLRRAATSAESLIHLGFSHRYLLNSVFAVTALHLFREDPSRTRWYARAVAHQQAAIIRARPHFHTLEECPRERRALLNFSAYTSVYEFIEPLLRPRGASAVFDPIKEFVHAVRLGRYTTIFVRQHLESITASDALPASKFDNDQVSLPACPASDFPQLAELRYFIERECDDAEVTLYLHAAESIFAGIAIITDDRQDIEDIRVAYKCATMVNSAFWDLCSEVNSVALVILAHFAVMLNLVRKCWYLKSWAATLVDHISKILKDQWVYAVQWPLEMIIGRRPIIPSSIGRGPKLISNSSTYGYGT